MHHDDKAIHPDGIHHPASRAADAGPGAGGADETLAGAGRGEGRVSSSRARRTAVPLRHARIGGHVGPAPGAAERRDAGLREPGPHRGHRDGRDARRQTRPLRDVRQDGRREEPADAQGRDPAHGVDVEGRHDGRGGDPARRRPPAADGSRVEVPARVQADDGGRAASAGHAGHGPLRRGAGEARDHDPRPPHPHRRHLLRPGQPRRSPSTRPPASSAGTSRTRRNRSCR